MAAADPAADPGSKEAVRASTPPVPAAVPLALPAAASELVAASVAPAALAGVPPEACSAEIKRKDIQASQIEKLNAPKALFVVVSFGPP